jgi:predicted lipoprotein with Yx(FWY)xxD motif
MRNAAAILAIVLAAAIAGCGGGDDSDAGGGGRAAAAQPPAEPAKKTSPQGQAAAGRGAGITVKVAGSEFGEILFDGDDRAIYLFEKEASSRSECSGACAEAWPPVLTEAPPQTGAGAKAGLLGTTRRTDGSTQVTYNGHPLYYYVDDPRGQVLCHNVQEFGGLWLVVDAAGEAVQ